MGLFSRVLHPGCTLEPPGDSDVVGLGGPWVLMGKSSREFSWEARVENTHLQSSGSLGLIP